MKKYYGYNISDEVWSFIVDMTNYVETNFGFEIYSPESRIYIEPIEDYILVKTDLNTFKYCDLKDFLLSFEMSGKKIVELLEQFDFAE